jgi:hypothetical protein
MKVEVVEDAAAFAAVCEYCDYRGKRTYEKGRATASLRHHVISAKHRTNVRRYGRKAQTVQDRIPKHAR